MTRTPKLEALESRLVPAVVDLTAPEQLLLELINRARANPNAEALLYNVSLSPGVPPGSTNVAPLPPLAPNQLLLDAARAHSLDMLTRNYFSVNTPEGTSPLARIEGAGYLPVASGENIATGDTANTDTTLDVQTLHRETFQTDAFRANILRADLVEVGPGVVGVSSSIGGTTFFQAVDATEDFGSRSGAPFSLTGVVFTDRDANQFYSVGEGQGNVTVTATDVFTGQVFTTTTGAAGGYVLPLPTGVYEVTIQGFSGFVQLDGANVKVDFRTSSTGLPQLLGASTTPPTISGTASTSATFGVGPDKAGVFRDGTWFLDSNGNRTLDAGDASFVFGRPGDQPVVGDWNGDGHTKVGVFRNVGGVGQFTLDTNGDRVFDAGDQVFFFGLGTDRALAGDWDGSGKSKVGVVRDNGQGTLVFSLDVNNDHVFDPGDAVFTFGRSGDTVVIGDWNGDRRSKVGVVRDNGQGVAQWSTDFNGDHVFDAGDQVFTFGLASDTPVVGDWTGANRDRPGVARDSGTGLLWSIDFNGSLVFDPGDLVFVFGASGDIPVVGKW